MKGIRVLRGLKYLVGCL